MRNKRHAFCASFRITGRALATLALLSAVGTLSCGGGTSSSAVPEIQVSVNPPTAHVALNGQVQFSATVTGTTVGVSWSVNGIAGGNSTVGEINSTGLYTAPSNLPSPNSVTVSATSLADSTQSASSSVNIVYPAPVIGSISPAMVVVGSASVDLTVSGSGFCPQSVVLAGGAALSTLYADPTALTAMVPAAQLAIPGGLAVQVSNPTPGGGTSPATTFTVAEGVFPTANPQVASYYYYTPQAASVAVEFGTDTTYGTHTWAQNTPSGGGVVQIFVAGMMPNTTYHMRADATFADGTQAVDQDQTFTTGSPLASRIPVMTVTNPNGLPPSSGPILWHLTEGTSNQLQIVASDEAGNLIWYYDYPSSLGVPQPVKLLPNGHMLINLSVGGVSSNPGTVQEIDLAGDIISQFTAAQLNTWLSNAGIDLTVATIHHDFLPLPNGHLILIVNHTKDFTDLPGYPGTTAVVGDALIDLDQNHNPVWVWDSFDHMDVTRNSGLPDWTHTNSIVYSPDDGNLIISMRNQSWVLKIDYENGQGTGDILWRLGYQGDFTLTNGQNPDWFYEQHYANIVSPNSTGTFNLLVFDDGDNRVLDSAGDECGTSGEIACYSRVPIFQLDETDMTATLLWQDNLSPVYTFWGGSAQQLANTNVVFDVTAPSNDPTGARYMEATSDAAPQVVLQIEITGQNAYRAVHLPSLYPGVQW